MGFKASGATRRPRDTGVGGSPARGRGGLRKAPGAPAAKPREGADAAAAPHEPFAHRADWQAAVRATVEGLRYDLVDVERAARGLLRVTIDRRPGQTYAAPGDAITVDDCEAVTRQLQYALEVDGVDYARLEVSSPGLDRPLRTAADYERFAGEQIELALKMPFQGRKHYRGRLERVAGADTAGGAWQLVFEDGKATQVLTFALDEVRDARLVPVVNFKGRAAKAPAPATTGPDGDTAPGGAAAPGRENEEGRNR
ncbi:MAG: ribosome maturation factor RimP [Betaproteobacteria bacterium]|nr:ribosome maturation factor RimP [Betaproteobacteria bacterium]